MCETIGTLLFDTGSQHLGRRVCCQQGGADGDSGAGNLSGSAIASRWQLSGFLGAITGESWRIPRKVPAAGGS